MKVLVVRHIWGMSGLYECFYEIVDGKSVEDVANWYNEKHGEEDEPDKAVGENAFGFCNGNEETFLFMEFGG